MRGHVNMENINLVKAKVQIPFNEVQVKLIGNNLIQVALAKDGNELYIYDAALLQKGDTFELAGFNSVITTELTK